MTTLTLKRGPGRPPKVAAIEAAPEAPKVMTWADFKLAVRGKEISCVWFPDPIVPLLEIGNNVMVRVSNGTPAYQLVSGEIVELKG